MIFFMFFLRFHRYAEDLRLHPRNVWALRGAAECARRTGAPCAGMDAEAAAEAAAAAAARADVRITKSCLCRLSEPLTERVRAKRRRIAALVGVAAAAAFVKVFC